MPENPPPMSSQENPTNPVWGSVSIDASPGWWQDFSANADVYSESIISNNSSVTRQFVGQQRSAVQGFERDVHRRVKSMPDMDVNYNFQFGHERIHYVTRPEKSLLGQIFDVEPLDDFIAVEFANGSD